MLWPSANTLSGSYATLIFAQARVVRRRVRAVRARRVVQEVQERAAGGLCGERLVRAVDGDENGASRWPTGASPSAIAPPQ